MNRQRWIEAVGVAFTSKALFYGILNFIPLLNILHLLSNLERCELRNAFKWIGSCEKINLREKQLHGYEKLQKSLREGNAFISLFSRKLYTLQQAKSISGSRGTSRAYQNIEHVMVGFLVKKIKWWRQTQRKFKKSTLNDRCYKFTDVKFS